MAAMNGVVDTSTGLDLLHAIEVPDRIPAARYHDPDFYALEAELLWPHVWQMACRLEEIPEVGDVVEYEILDQSVMVIRTADGVQAFQNACRHRGVKLVDGRDRCESGFTCPFHGWCYGTDGKNTAVTRKRTFAEHNVEPGDLDLIPVRCEMWGGCAWINLDDEALSLRQSIEPVATILDAWKVDSLRAEWWLACRLPVNWKLAQEAFVEQYHVLETHPQLRIPGRMAASGKDFDPRAWVDAELHYLRVMSDGMDGMVHASDVAIAEQLAATIELPADPALATQTWHRTYNDAVTSWHHERGHDLPDLNELEASGMNEPMGYVFPHYFVLPMYSSASSYRFRPLGPEETLMEIWSMTRYPDGAESPRPQPPEVWTHDDERWPPIPAQDFSNLPRQQRGLHTKGFEYMRLSEKAEGHISNFHRTIDRYLAARPRDEIQRALRWVNVNPLEMPIVDLDA